MIPVIAMRLPWGCCGIAAVLMWDPCGIYVESPVALLGSAVILLWYCRGLAVLFPVVFLWYCWGITVTLLWWECFSVKLLGDYWDIIIIIIAINIIMELLWDCLGIAVILQWDSCDCCGIAAGCLM